TLVLVRLKPRRHAGLVDAVGSGSRKDLPISIAGCRHSMSGQQFVSDGICIDIRDLAHVLNFDRERGLIEAEAGIQWPELIRAYLDLQCDSAQQWGIAQKQTGADTFTLAGTLSSNVHGFSLR